MIGRAGSAQNEHERQIEPGARQWRAGNFVARPKIFAGSLHRAPNGRWAWTCRAQAAADDASFGAAAATVAAARKSPRAARGRWQWPDAAASAHRCAARAAPHLCPPRTRAHKWRAVSLRALTKCAHLSSPARRNLVTVRRRRRRPRYRVAGQSGGRGTISAQHRYGGAQLCMQLESGPMIPLPLSGPQRGSVSSATQTIAIPLVTAAASIAAVAAQAHNADERSHYCDSPPAERLYAGRRRERQCETMRERIDRRQTGRDS